MLDDSDSIDGVTNGTWTIAELTDHVAGVLSDKDAGQANGRVREVPDARTIRWYQTTGLVDRPGMRGRTASYGQRHLLQLLAIKRLQGQGEPLASIQARIAGASDKELAEIADLPLDTDLPPGVHVDVQTPDRHTAARTRFWSGMAARHAPAPGRDAATSGTTGHSSDQGRTPAPPAAIRIHNGVLLVVDGTARGLEPADEEAVREAAAALLDTLHRRGLLPPGTLPGEVDPIDAGHVRTDPDQSSHPHTAEESP